MITTVVFNSKVCKTCKKEKNDYEFYKSGKYLFPYCKECTYEKTHAWRKANPDKLRYYKILANYGITRDVFMAMVTAQNSLCAICGKEFRPALFVVDHDHKTKKIRGLLCSNCNHGLGKFLEEPIILNSAITYLKKYL